ncbi:MULTISPECIES: hypothetical protein [unclassified Paracoccus (in: a-proteobacteria)]|nr:MULTISPECIES: hypothetical protein [unclassified Paracoccus (in: a-proteobacteria)]
MEQEPNNVKDQPAGRTSWWATLTHWMIFVSLLTALIGGAALIF